MESFASKYNKNPFDIDTKNFSYVKLSDIFHGEEEIHRIDGIFVRRSPLGDSPVIADREKGLLVNIPAHLGGTFRQILSDADAVSQIKAGKVGYTIYTYESHGKTCYSISFVDL